MSGKGYAALAVFVLVTLLAFSVAGGALYARFREGDSTRKKLTAISLDNCREIEKLKTAQRERAIENFGRLDANLRLLHIPKTPDVVRAAQDSLDRDLVRFAAAPCPRR